MNLYDKASLILTPNGFKASKLYSLKPTDGTGDFTFSRTGNATRVNSAGLIESVATNVPRLNYPSGGGCPSVLLEPARTNLALYSENLDDTYWLKTNISVTANSSISPSGLQNADTLISSGGSTSFFYKIFSLTSGVTYTISFYVKSNTPQTIRLYGGTLGIGSSSNLNVTSDWTRISYTFTPTSSGNADIGIRPNTLNDNFNIFAWGAQLEAGSYATSYIPTTTASVTRNADSITRNNIFTNGLITASGGTWFVELRNNVPLVKDTIARFGVGDTSVLNSNSLVISNLLTTSSRFILYKVITFNYTAIFTSNANTTKLAIKWNGSTADVFANGIKVVTATAFTTTNMEFFGTSGVDVPKFINEMALFPTPLTDAECAALTTL